MQTIQIKVLQKFHFKNQSATHVCTGIGRSKVFWSRCQEHLFETGARFQAKMLDLDSDA